MNRAILHTGLMSGLAAVSLVADPGVVQQQVAQLEEGHPDQIFLVTRAESLPVDTFEDATDPYLEGYIQALIDVHFYEYRVVVTVKDHHVFLANLPKNQLLAQSIINFVRDLPDVQSVEVKELSAEEATHRAQYVEQPRVNGIWFPQSTVLFQPLVADPRQPTYSVALRLDDHVVGDVAAAVSLGDEFPIFRWKDILPWHGDMQIGIDGGVWAVFNYTNIPHHNHETCELVNADYYVGIPVTYAFDRWAFRLRAYHISSHLGDEFLVNNPEYIKDRKNPSFEALDYFASYQFSPNFRFYGGLGWVFHSDDSFHLKPFYVEYGAEVRLFGQKLYYHRLYGTPFFAVDIQNWQQQHWNLNVTFKLGYELSKLQGIGRKMRVYVDYHQGYSFEGQFFNEKTNYTEFGFSWGF